MSNCSSICSPFAHLKINDFHQLDEEKGRTTCPECNRSRKYFCYTCYVPVPRLKPLTPRVKLPLHIDIIKHPLERDGKSTACHAAVISPEYVHIHTFPVFPDFDQNKTILLYPGEDAVQLEDMTNHPPPPPSPSTPDNICKKTGIPDESCVNGENVEFEGLHPKSETVIEESSCDRLTQCRENSKTLDSSNRHNCSQNGVLTSQNHCAMKQTVSEPQDEVVHNNFHVVTPSFDRVIFIDATWNQTYGILQDERLKGLRKVELRSRTSRFWRHQKGSPDTYLSTIEAIYYFVRDYHDLFVRTPYDGQYDNLLFFFSCLYEKVNIAKANRINGI